MASPAAAAAFADSGDEPRKASSSSRSSSSVTWSLIAACANLFIAAAGAGLLSYPFAVKEQGIGLALVLSAIFAAFNAYTCLILAQASYSLRAYLKAATYEEVMLRAVTMDPARGSLHTYFWFALCIVLNCGGSVIGFQQIVGDLGSPAIAALCTASRGAGDAVCGIVGSRVFVTYVFAVFVAIPLSTSPKMHHLFVGSLLAGVTVL